MDKRRMNKILIYLLGGAIVLGTVGCAVLEPTDPKNKLSSHTIGFGPINIGMTKDEIRSLWGDPDIIRYVGESQDLGQTSKEEWIYYGRISQLPVNYGYLAKALHLYFDGQNLTGYKQE
jgi:hypothetical protein